MSKKVKVIPLKEAAEMEARNPAIVYPFEENIKNKHSVYTLCPNCHTWGINMPGEKMCGDCNFPYGITYYSAEDVNNLIKKIIANQKLLRAL